MEPLMLGEETAGSFGKVGYWPRSSMEEMGFALESSFNKCLVSFYLWCCCYLWWCCRCVTSIFPKLHSHRASTYIYAPEIFIQGPFRSSEFFFNALFSLTWPSSQRHFRRWEEEKEETWCVHTPERGVCQVSSPGWSQIASLFRKRQRNGS